MKSLCIVPVICAAGPGATQPSPAPWVGDNRFNAVFDMYWRARLLQSYAGSRLCSLRDRPNYEDPKSPYRPIDQRLFAAGNRIEARWPKALNTVRRPYMMPPPQLLCQDEKAAYEALFAFETGVTALERLLDDLERKDHAAN